MFLNFYEANYIEEKNRDLMLFINIESKDGIKNLSDLVNISGRGLNLPNVLTSGQQTEHKIQIGANRIKKINLI
jgi:hypothetical protein